jgi:HK97 family phage prohead protease
MELIRKDLDFDIREAGDPKDRTLEFVGSTGHVDRYGDVIEVEGWDLKNYKKNPVFLWAHDYRQPPVGKAVKVEKTDKGLLFRVKFPTPEEYPFADTVYKLYLGGYLRATSVGFQDLEREPINDKEGKQSGWRFKKQELYELSAVPVPANPQALVMAVQKGVVSPREVEDVMGVPFESGLAEEKDEAAVDEAVSKGVIPFKDYPKDPEDAPWDGPAEVKAAEMSDLKKMCAWFDSENPDVKGSYTLPHHRAEGYNTVWQGVSAAMAALLGARGGVNIPEADIKGVYNHLAKHYAQFDKEPPELKAYGDADLALIGAGLLPLLDKYFSHSVEVKEMVEALYEKAAAKGLISALLQLIAALYDWLAGNKEFDLSALQALKALYEPATLPEAETSITVTISGDELQQVVREVIDEIRDQVQGWHESAPDNDIYSLALNPGYKPQGGRPAGEPDINRLLASTQKLHQTVKGGINHGS